MSDDNMYVIKYDKIITMTEVTEKKMITFYNKYLNDEDCDWEEDGKTKISDKMGYITTVDAARKMLENLYNSKDSKES